MMRAILGLTLLCALFLHSEQAKAAPKNVAFTLEVKRSGLDYEGDCVAKFFKENNKSDSPDVVQRNLSAKTELKSGRYQVQLECGSSEGTLTQTFEFDILRDMKKSVRLKPGFAIVRVLRDKQEVPATLTFYDRFGRVVQKGRDLSPLPLPPGAIRVIARVDKKALEKSDAMRRNKRELLGSSAFKVRAGKKTKVRTDTSDGKLLVKTLHNGKSASASVSLRLPGTRREVARFVSGKSATVPPGVYDAVTRLDEAYDFHEEKTRVTIKPRKTTRAKTSHQSGGLRVRVLKNGKAIKDEVTLELFLGAAPESFNSMTQNDVAILGAGTYRVAAQVGAVRAEKSVKVRTRKKSLLTLDLSPAFVDITTTMGKTKSPMRIEIEDDRKKIVAKKRTSKEGTLSLELQPGDYRLRAFYKSAQGVLKEEARFEVKKAKRSKSDIVFEYGRALVQVFERGVSVPAEVAFYREEAQDPLLKTQAGKEVFLPTGRYEVVVSRNAYTRNFSGVGIALGELSERQIDWLDEKGRVPESKAQQKKRLK